MKERKTYTYKNIYKKKQKRSRNIKINKESTICTTDCYNNGPVYSNGNIRKPCPLLKSDKSSTTR